MDQTLAAKAWDFRSRKATLLVVDAMVRWLLYRVMIEG